MNIENIIIKYIPDGVEYHEFFIDLCPIDVKFCYGILTGVVTTTYTFFVYYPNTLSCIFYVYMIHVTLKVLRTNSSYSRVLMQWLFTAFIEILRMFIIRFPLMNILFYVYVSRYLENNDSSECFFMQTILNKHEKLCNYIELMSHSHVE